VVLDPSAIDRHIQRILRIIKPGPIRRKRFKVAIDCCNGAGSEISRKLLKNLGCKVEAINCDTSLPFPHPPEPVAENLRQLCRLVKSKKADIGFAFDSDADRLAIVSEKGKPVGEEITLALAVKFLLKHSLKKKIVVTNLSTTRAIDDIVREKGGILIRTKVGEVHVAEELKNLKGLIGGEGNGGVIYPLIGMNRDALAALALLLSYLAENNKSISDLIAEIPPYFMLKKKIKCRTQDAGEKFIEKVKESFRRKDLILTEGVKVVLPSGWVHVRASNTEPIIRIIAEGKTKSGAKNLIKQVLKPLR
jgi:phosphomannomutase